MIYMIYNKSDGKITRCVSCSVDNLVVNADEAVHEGSPGNYTHVINGSPVYRESGKNIPAIESIRNARTALLAACDWTQIPDVPLAPEQKQAWVEYRQQLRDFPDTCDPLNPVWPTPPA